MNRIVFSLLILCFFSFSKVCAQSWFSEIDQGEKIDGFVIGIAGDTIKGKITYDYPIVMQNRLIFTEKGNPGKEIQYIPFGIWGYSFNNMYYESTQVLMETYQGTYRFNRFGILTIKPGAIGIYRIYPEKDKLKRNVSSLEAETEYENIQQNPSENDYSTLYMKKLEEPAIYMGSKSFQKKFEEIIGTMVSDNSTLYNKVNTTGMRRSMPVQGGHIQRSHRGMCKLQCFCSLPPIIPIQLLSSRCINKSTNKS